MEWEIMKQDCWRQGCGDRQIYSGWRCRRDMQRATLKKAESKQTVMFCPSCCWFSTHNWPCSSVILWNPRSCCGGWFYGRCGRITIHEFQLRKTKEASCLTTWCILDLFHTRITKVTKLHEWASWLSANKWWWNPSMHWIIKLAWHSCASCTVDKHEAAKPRPEWTTAIGTAWGLDGGWTRNRFLIGFQFSS